MQVMQEMQEIQELQQISKLASEKLHSQYALSPKILEYNLLDAMANLEYEHSKVMSELCITPLNCFGNNAVLPTGILHIIMGFISDQSFSAQLNIGGADYGKPLNIIGNTTTLGLVDENNQAWPIVNTEYHELRLKIIRDIPKDTKIWAVGVRLLKDKLHLLDKTLVPGILLYQS